MGPGTHGTLLEEARGCLSYCQVSVYDKPMSRLHLVGLLSQERPVWKPCCPEPMVLPRGFLGRRETGRDQKEPVCTRVRSRAREEAWTSWEGSELQSTGFPLGPGRNLFHLTPVGKASGKWIRALEKEAEVTVKMLCPDTATCEELGGPGLPRVSSRQTATSMEAGGSPHDSESYQPQGRDNYLTASEIPPPKGSLCTPLQ